MSKSLGNFFTIREIFQKSSYLQTITAEVLRYFLLSTHYRSPIDFSDQSLKLAKSALDNFYILFQKLEECKGKSGKGDAQLAKDLKAFPTAFEKAMDDDFNTAGAIAQLQKLRNQVNRAITKGVAKKTASAAKKIFLTYGKMLGLFQLQSGDGRFTRQEAESGFGARVRIVDSRRGDTAAPADDDPEIIRVLVAAREEARKRKDWAEADRIRDLLTCKGVILEDRPDGTTRVRR
jgi:cysteinyl-tRNA synthetase